jgi:hypothetical protein
MEKTGEKDGRWRRGRGKGGKATGPTVRVLVMDVELFRVVREAELS